MIEILSMDNQSKLHSKDQQIEDLQKRIDSLVLKIVRRAFLFLQIHLFDFFQDGHKDEIFHLQEINQILQTRMDETNQKTVKNFLNFMTFATKFSSG